MPQARKAVALVFADYVVDTGKSYPQLATIKKTTGMSVETIQKHIAEIIADGLLTDTGVRTGEAKDVVVYQFNAVAEIKPAAKKKREKTPEDLLEARQIYDIYPRPVDPKKTLPKIKRAITQFGFEIVMEGTRKFAELYKSNGTPIALIPHPSTFFNNERFTQDPKMHGLVAKTQKQAERFADPAHAPTLQAVMNYSLEREHDRTTASRWGTDFYRFWKQRRWMQNGRPLDWQIEFHSYITKQRELAANPVSFDRSKISAPSGDENKPTN